MNSVGIFMYEGSPLFEIIVAAYILKTKYDVKLILDGKNTIISTEGIGIVQNCDIDKIDIQHMEAFIICGGNKNKIYSKMRLEEVIRTMDGAKKVIAGICAGREVVKEALNLGTAMPETTELIHDRILLSPPNEYVKFGIEIGRILHVYQDKEDYDETITFFEQGKAVE